jgi:hypothetical protein
MVVPTTFYFILKEPIMFIDWLINNFFWNIEHAPIEAPLWTPGAKQRKCSPPTIYLCGLYT